MKNQPSLDHLTPTLRHAIARECCLSGRFHASLACELVETLAHDYTGSIEVAHDQREEQFQAFELGFLSDADLASQVLELCEVS